MGNRPNSSRKQTCNGFISTKPINLHDTCTESSSVGLTTVVGILEEEKMQEVLGLRFLNLCFLTKG